MDSRSAGYKRFPPRRGHIQIPVSSRSAARAGLSLYTGCKPVVVRLQEVTDRYISILGARMLPGRTAELDVPLDARAWGGLLENLRRVVSGFDEMAVYSQWQGARSGFALLLLRHGIATHFVKLKAGDHAGFDNEATALREVERCGPTVFDVPRLVGRGRIGELDWLATTAMTGRMHRPAPSISLDSVCGEIDRCLRDWPRPAGVPSGYHPMHGDLTPWNLRQISDGRLALIDWEDVRWAPLGADAVYYWALARAMGLRCVVSAELLTQEAAEFWHGQLARRRREGHDERTNRRYWERVEAAFRQLHGRASSPDIEA